MNPKQLGGLTAALLALALSAPTRAQTYPYAIATSTGGSTSLQTLGRNNTYAFAINNKGEITGYVEENPSFPPLATYWNSLGAATSIGYLSGGSYTVGYAISANARIVGEGYNGTRFVPFSGGTTGSLFDMSGGRTGAAYGVNDDWGVVGWANFSNNHSAFVHGSGSSVVNSSDDLGGGTSSEARGINGSGQIVGAAIRPPTNNWHALLWNPNGTSLPGSQGWNWTDIGTLGGTYSFGFGINDAGQAVGESTLGNGTLSAFLWTSGGISGYPTNPEMQDLSDLGGGGSTAYSVNFFGKVVGRALDPPSGQYHAFVWDAANLIQDLNSLIDPAAGWLLTEARGINDRGQIVGNGMFGGVHRAFLLTPVATLDTLSVSPAEVTGGTSATATITLTSPAPTGGIIVDLSSDTPSLAAVPATVTVPAGQTSATFAVTTSSTATDTDVTILATHGSDNPQATVLTVRALRHVIAVDLGNGGQTATVVGGTSISAFVTLDTPAPAGGATVALSSNNASAQVPASVTVVEGSTTGTFTITTTLPTADVNATITGTYNGTATATLTIQTVRRVISVDLGNGGQTANVVGGNSITGFVTLNVPALAGGVDVALSSSNAVAQVPASVHVLPGLTTATFTVTTSAPTVDTNATITATLNGTATATVTVIARRVISVDLGNGGQTANVAGGTSISAFVTLNVAAPAGGTTVALSSNNANAQVPASVTVASGSTTGSFTITTTQPLTTQTATITGTYNGTATAALTVRAPVPSTLTLNPTAVFGGASSTATVTLDLVAGPAGVTVALSSSNTSAATVPATVKVLSGKTSVTFVVATKGVAVTATPTISATYNGVTKSAILTVAPASLLQLSFSPNIVKGGQKTALRIVLTGIAPPGGAVIALSTSSNRLAIPASTTVPAGASSVTLNLEARVVTSNTLVTVTGTYKGVSKSATVTVTP